MKWSKAREYLSEIPWLSRKIGNPSERIAEASRRNVSESELLRRWITDKVKYIAVRPFDNLNLSLRPVFREFKINPIWGQDGDGISYSIEYVIVNHCDVGGRRTYQFSDIVQLAGQSAPETVLDVARVLARGHQPYYKKAGLELVFEAVLEKRRIESETFGVLLETYDIYKFPPEWKP